MQNDITPPKHHKSVDSPSTDTAHSLEVVSTQELISDQIAPPKQKSRKKLVVWIFLSIVALLVVIVSGFLIWYTTQLSAVTTDTQKLIPFTVIKNSTPKDIGTLLETKGVIRSSLAFEVYTRISGTRGKLQAGTYRLKPSDSTSDIVKHLVNGDVEPFSITFYPGATLKQHRQVLIDAGYSAKEVDAALSLTYDSPLFAGKPAGSDLEGYIYGETYSFNAGASVKDILNRTFAQYLSALEANDLMKNMTSHGYTLYQAITLASIIQREVSSPADRKQVAQIFYLRLRQGEALGSDVTYQYAADKLGVQRDVNLDSPYNTRRYAGLPPGPISSPGLSSLQAVASPAPGDYLYFLSGDNGTTYFAHTNAEHEANIKNYCQQKCSTL